MAIDKMQELLADTDFDVLAGAESRGFIFGMPIAYNLHKPFVPIRKKGKLPRETVSVSYDLEYGSAEIEMHKDSIKPGQKVVIVDDLIATGGTIEAAIKLVEQLGGEVDGISVGSTAKAVIIGVVQLHAGVAVRMERTAHHAMAVGLHAVHLSHLPNGDGGLDLLI